MLIEELKKRDIILASRSPRRKELLANLDISFRVVVPDIPEVAPDGLTRDEIAVHLAERKAAAVLEREKGSMGDLLVIASDTIVCKGKQLLNKPCDREDAIGMLKKLSGRKHCVITGVCIADHSSRRTFFAMTEVYFASLEDEEIEYYIDNYRPYDKAGSYGIQEWIGFIGIERIEGSYFNVMGLPVHKLYIELKSFLDK